MYACTIHKLPMYVHVQYKYNLYTWVLVMIWLALTHPAILAQTPSVSSPFPLPQKPNSILGKRLVTRVANFDLFITYENGNIV